MSVAIVAIPRDIDLVWKYSSEKVPHMTLLYLGDQSDNSDLYLMTQYISHLADNTLPFYMMVDKRGVLGPDNADVLFFSKDRHGRSTASEFRRYLLENETIRKAYESVEQYPDWTPHLTMGYPKTPAKKDDREYGGFFGVEFDRVALWTGDYSGPEFKLTYPALEEVDMVMGDTVMEFLEHHGVKGMKWGVRNDRDHEGERATNKKIAKLDKKYERSSAGKYFAVYNAMADRMNKTEIDRINNDPRFKGRDLTDWTKPSTKAYLEEYSKTATRILNEESGKLLGTNASGTKRWQWNYDVENSLPTAEIVDVDKVKHADTATPVEITWGEKGFIKKIKLPNNLTHIDNVENFLEHFGVKGMRWGIRKEDAIPAGEVRVTQKKPGARVTTAGGHGVPAHPDAIKAATSRQKAKSSSTDSLSNKELQELVTRLNLEQQYSRLATSQKGTLARGNSKIKEILDTKNTVDRVLSDPTVKPFVEKAAKDIFDAIRK